MSQKREDVEARVRLQVYEATQLMKEAMDMLEDSENRTKEQEVRENIGLAKDRLSRALSWGRQAYEAADARLREMEERRRGNGR